jgi:uncharacterized phage-associated protein
MADRQYSPEIPPYIAPLIGFRSRKAAQICTRFALRSGGGIEKLKLIKLVYLAERKFLREHLHPMLFDELFSLPHGPICSSTLNGINGWLHNNNWDELLTRNGNHIWAAKELSRDDLDEVSDAEIDVVDAVWTEHGAKTASQLRNYSHDNCPEYTELEEGRIPISYREILEAL